jgi:tetratricopeptide (TPR) repeat protein
MDACLFLLNLRTFMISISRQIISSLLLLGFLIISQTVAAQEKPYGLEVDKWAVHLSKAQLNEVNSLGSLTQQLIEVDSVRSARFLDSLERSPLARGYFFRTFFCMIKADVLYAKYGSLEKFKDRHAKELQPIKEQMMKLYADALDAVYRTGKDITIGWVNFYSARRMRHFGETSWAVMYSKNGVDLFEKVGYPVEPPVYTELAELLFDVREYDEASLYARKGLLAWKGNNYEEAYKERFPYKFKIRALQTIGHGFYQRRLYDSAAVYYQQALSIAVSNNDNTWTGKCLGNIGRLLYAARQFDSAYTLFNKDYVANKDSAYHDAARASYWMANTSLNKGQALQALEEARQAVRLLKRWPEGNYLRDSYASLSQIFRAMGNYDSAFYYNDRYQVLHDSLEKQVATSSLAISKAKLNDEVSRFNMERLDQQKKTEVLWRNILIVGILLVAVICIIAVNRQRLKEKIQKEQTEKEKQFVEQEVASAREQLRMFTSSIVEKTSLIEKLEEQVRGKTASAEQQAIMNELSQQTILTQDDWTRFKLLFEKIYPGFFIQLKEKFPEITVAEQRMAALTKLRLTTKQVASMLGISVDSVHKSRQRLRQRLQISSDDSLDELVAQL